VGSAVNDTTRQVGGALGVAIIGSVASSLYSSHVIDAIPAEAPPRLAGEIENSLGVALQVGARFPGLADAAQTAFVDGMRAGVLVAAAAAILGAIVTALWLPARSRDAQEGEDDQAEGEAAVEPVQEPAPTS